MKEVGNGKKMKFWMETWTGEVRLRDKFQRLYNLSEQKQSMISEMGKWSEGVWCWDLKWRRQLPLREQGLLNEMMQLIGKVKLKVDVEDFWRWNLSAKGRYSTKEAYSILWGRRTAATSSREEKKRYKWLWNNHAPRKAKVMAWKF